MAPTARPHFALLVALVSLTALALLARAAGKGTSSTDPPAVNKFYVRWSYALLDPLHKLGYFVMPRTEAAARKDGWAVAAGHARRADRTSLWLRRGDYRVGLLFDGKGSVAGVQTSVSVAEVKSSKTTYPYGNSDEWFPQTLAGIEVYSSIAYFVSESTLRAGGRTFDDATPTAPQLSLLHVRPGTARETGRRAVANTEKAINAEGWTTQGCFSGQGLHNYDGLSKASTCPIRSYFVHTHPQAHTVTAVGLNLFGKFSDGPRKWLEENNSKNLRNIMFNAPECLFKQIDDYGIFTLHLFFNDKPWDVKC